jgi:ATP-dependent protease ClpP protease subunit
MKLILMILMIPLMGFSQVQDTIVLTESNSVMLRGPVSWESVTEVQKDLLLLSASVRESQPIYIVLDSPGGSVPAADMFITTMQSLPQPIHTISIFSASAAFQIAQHGKVRYGLRNTTLMSHRAVIRTSGQLDGELESRVNLYKNMVNIMDIVASNRVGLSMEVYKEKILNEWWVYGQDNIKQNTLDKIVNMQCSKSLIKGTVEHTVDSLFGSRTFLFSKCPLLVAPIGEKIQRYRSIKEKSYYDLLFNDKPEFIKRHMKNTF